MFTVYGYPQTRTTRVLWALEEAGLAYKLRLINLRENEQRAPDYLALNPVGKVPTLVDGDFVLAESAAICTYIAERAPRAGLLPVAGSRDRARCDRWCYFVIGELEQPLWTMAKHSYALPQKLRVPAVIATARQEFARAAQAMAKDLAGADFALGEQFSIADILLAHTLSWARAFEVSFGDEALECYADRQLGRPALARAREKEQAALV